MQITKIAATTIAVAAIVRLNAREIVLTMVALSLAVKITAAVAIAK